MTGAPINLGGRVLLGIRRIALPSCILALSIDAPGGAEDFYNQRGSDPTFEEVMKSGKLPRGRNSANGFEGSRIKVNDDLLRDGPNARRPLIRDILIHTLGSSAIRRNDFPKWSRWYQEDGNTQVFRLFKGEENVRNSRELAARIEAFSEFNWKKGDGWQEWVATYTIIKPHRCAIFQAKNPINDWSVMINMNDDGDVSLNHRRGEDKVMARRMTGKPFHIRIRENGYDYEVYFNGKKEGEGSYSRPKGQTGFRWGMYLGAKEVRHDAMILVTGAAINPRDPDAGLAEQAAAEEKPPEPAPVPGVPIPSRVWKNRSGGDIRAEARYQPGSDVIRFLVGGKWIAYPLADLSDDDRRELTKASETVDE
ncbi:hypothetical protein HZ994_11495 [Akkermansiaceae bacterium]|nr:hypothetical protein HZ994_11495 [Akkermansiaceae bacterium]